MQAIPPPSPKQQNASHRPPDVTGLLASAPTFPASFITRLSSGHLCLQGVGSGFVWDEEGHVVTNYHVINDSANVKVRTLVLLQ